MTRTAIRHALSVLAAVAIASASASGPTSAGEGRVLRDWIVSSYWIPGASKSKSTSMKKGSQQTGAVLPHPIRDYALSASNSR